jgi:formylglycine-generating enzyme required for sulfatase activity
MALKRFKLVLVFALGLGLISGLVPFHLCYAEDTITGQYCYTYGDTESLVEARKTTKTLAIRDAIESHRVFVRSTSEVKDFQLSEDFIRTITLGSVRNVKVIEHTEKGRTICETIQASVSPQELEGLIKREIGKKAPQDTPLQTITNSVGMKFVSIPSGSFMMGSNSEYQEDKPVHRVTITRPFYLQTTEVTQGQWRKVMGNNPSFFKNCGDDCPVEKVSWNDAQKFIRKLNQMERTDKYRLPSEAEWEYACRAGSITRFSFGDNESSLSEYAWYENNSGGKTHPVGQKRPNAWGLYDMHGNVGEWCQDWQGRYPAGHVTDPKGGSDGKYRVRRGGSWNNPPGSFGLPSRHWSYPVYREVTCGFRVARAF